MLTRFLTMAVFSAVVVPVSIAALSRSYVSDPESYGVAFAILSAVAWGYGSLPWNNKGTDLGLWVNVFAAMFALIAAGLSAPLDSMCQKQPKASDVAHNLCAWVRPAR